MTLAAATRARLPDPRDAMPDPINHDTAIATMRRIVLRHAGRSSRTIPRLSVTIVPRPTSGGAGSGALLTCLPLQGAKQLAIGGQEIVLQRRSHLVASLDRPATGRVIEASPDRPFIAVGLNLDRLALAELIDALPAAATAAGEGVAADTVTPDLAIAWLRVVELFDRPHDIAGLAAIRERELLYQLLTGPLGRTLRAAISSDHRLARVRRSIDWLRHHYDRPLSIGELAEIAAMSVASFNRHFRRVTATSPLQYQKRLRLQTARRRLTAGDDVGSAAFAVGYESASQFSREFTRLFGHTPGKVRNVR